MTNGKRDILYRPLKELKSLQDRKLRHFISSHLYPFSPYYRGLFDKNKIKPGDIKTSADLKKIPFTSKDDFLSEKSPTQRSIEFILQPDKELIKKYLPKTELLKFSGLKLLRGEEYLKKRLEEEYRPIFLTATAGTTNRPVSFLYTAYDIENLKVYGKRIIDVSGIGLNDRAMNVFPYAPHLAFWQTVFAGFSSNLFVLSTGGGKTLGTDGNIRSMLKMKPNFLIGVPSYVYHILKTARGENLDLSFLGNIALGASRVPEGFKKKIAGLLHEMGSHQVKVVGTYGFTEARAAWCECPTDIGTSSGYHISPDKEIFEVIDPDTGQVKGEGEDGELVYTGIDGRGSCVVRYRTGDLVKGGIVYSPCPHCGRTVPRISSDITRASNIKDLRFSKIKGALVNLNDLEYILDNEEVIDEWQIEIVKKNNDPYEVDELVLYASLLKKIDEKQYMMKLTDAVFNSTEVSFNSIKFISRREMTHKIEIESAVKAKKIVDKRPKA